MVQDFLFFSHFEEGGMYVISVDFYQKYTVQCLPAYVTVEVSCITSSPCDVNGNLSDPIVNICCIPKECD